MSVRGVCYTALAFIIFYSKDLARLSIFFCSSNGSSESLYPIAHHLANRYASSRLMGILLMFTSFGAGCRLFWLMNEANWTMVMKQVGHSSSVLARAIPH
jgi:hypothetical protein